MSSDSIVLQVAAGWLILALGGGAASAKEAGGTPVAFVASGKASQLIAVDLTTKRVVGRIPVPSGPRSVAATGTRFLLVTSPAARKVALVDSVTRRVVKIFGGFGRPLDVAAERGYAYVTDARRNELVVIDLAQRKVVSRVAVPRRPQNVAVGDVALVTHSPPNPYLTFVNLPRPGAPRVSVRRLAVPAVGGARDVSRQPDSANAYVTGWSSGGAAGVDWGNGRPLWWRNVGTSLRHVAFDYFHGRRVWVSDHARGEVIALSSRDGHVVRRLHGCPGARQIALGGQAWIAATCEGSLAIWDTRGWKRTLVPIPPEAHGVAVAVVP